MSEATIGTLGPMKRKIRAWRGEPAWREIFDRQRRGGLDISTFCAAEGISRASFNRWHTRLKSGPIQRDRVEADPKFGDPGVADGAEAFVDAGALRMGGAEPLEIRLELGGALVLTIRRG